MKRAMLFAGAAMISVMLSFGGVQAQGTAQTVELVKVDIQTLAAGYRASRVIGSSVVNDANETIGKIDDLLVSSDGKRPYAVLSIGGFLGMGSHMVIVPYELAEIHRQQGDAAGRHQGRAQDAAGVQIHNGLIRAHASADSRRSMIQPPQAPTVLPA